MLPLRGYDAHRLSIPGIELLPDDELERLNALLPWASFIVDSGGRRFGDRYSVTKRAEAQIIPDPRIVALDARHPLANATVLEVGCFEGIHTAALAGLAKRVIAIDSRIENVVKTLVRCAMLQRPIEAYRVDLDQGLPEQIALECDVLHHVGVLYHLFDPVGHLREICAITREALMLDTHVAPPGARLEHYRCDGRQYAYYPFSEGGRSAPFAGMSDHAKWLREADLIELVHDCGFADVEVSERREERNGPRVLIHASR